jgi:hypothetical protein
MGGSGLDRCGSGRGQVVGCCECGSEPSGSVKCREFLDQLREDLLTFKEGVCSMYLVVSAKVYNSIINFSFIIIRWWAGVVWSV